jgi:hypothetical protein
MQLEPRLFPSPQEGGDRERGATDFRDLVGLVDPYRFIPLVLLLGWGVLDAALTGLRF